MLGIAMRITRRTPILFVRDGCRMTAARDRVVAAPLPGLRCWSVAPQRSVSTASRYHAVLRRRELGVRVAMGAAPAGVLRLVLGQAGVVVVSGLIAGAALSLGLGRLIRSLLFEVEPTDPLMIAVAIAILSVVTLAAGYLPARQAARIDQCWRSGRLTRVLRR
jgi:predicted lysophospholipase L1 biosynthesis ABC-type transport system permease subunit